MGVQGHDSRKEGPGGDGGQDVAGDQVMQRPQRPGTGADLIGQGREAEIDTLPGIALGIDRLAMLASGADDIEQVLWAGKP